MPWPTVLWIIYSNVIYNNTTGSTKIMGISSRLWKKPTNGQWEQIVNCHLQTCKKPPTCIISPIYFTLTLLKKVIKICHHRPSPFKLEDLRIHILLACLAGSVNNFLSAVLTWITASWMHSHISDKVRYMLLYISNLTMARLLHAGNLRNKRDEVAVDVSWGVAVLDLLVAGPWGTVSIGAACSSSVRLARSSLDGLVGNLHFLIPGRPVLIRDDGKSSKLLERIIGHQAGGEAAM